MTRLEERATQQEVRLGQLEVELVRKDELFSEIKEELTNDVFGAYGIGFEDAMAQVACVHPGMDLSQTGLAKSDGRGPSSGPSSIPRTRSMEKRIREDCDSATDGREMFLYMFKEDHLK